MGVKRLLVISAVIIDEGQMDHSENLAITVRGAQRSYGSLKVLKGLDMDVPYGSM